MADGDARATDRLDVQRHVNEPVREGHLAPVVELDTREHERSLLG